MTKNEDEKLVPKGAVKRILKKIERQDHVTIQGLFSDLQKAINKLPAVEIKSPEQIERAIGYLEELRDSHNIDLGGNLKAFQTHIDLLLLILNREQNVWDEEKIFGKAE